MKKVNPLKYNKILSRVFDQTPRRDFSIDCILENTICDLYIDKISNPTTFLIKMEIFIP